VRLILMTGVLIRRKFEHKDMHRGNMV
jgi:hypothetical protein